MNILKNNVTTTTTTTNRLWRPAMYSSSLQQVHIEEQPAAHDSSVYHLIINAFHSLPHLNMWFELSNSTFDPNNSEYLETILFWSTVPILFLIFILLILIIYACCLVVITNSTSTIKLNAAAASSSSSTANRYYKKHARLFKYKFFISLFVFLLSVSLGFIVYGSESFHHSFLNVTVNIRNFSNYFSTIGYQAKFAKDSIVKQINVTLNKFEFDLRKAIDNQSNPNNKLASEAIKELNGIKATLNDSYMALESLNQLEYERNAYVHLLNQINSAEQTRWAIMIGVVTINMLLITLLIIGLIRNSKGSLCFFAFAGVLSLISTWILNALYLGITVFIADYCTSPDQYVLTVAEKNQMKNLVNYYTTCSVSHSAGRSSHNMRYTPFKLELNKADSKLRTASTMYNDNLIRMSKTILGDELINSYNFDDSIKSIENVLDNIRSLIKCDQTSSNYRSAVNILCSNSILGLAIIVVSSILFGLILPILICIIPQMWRRMHKKDAFDYHTSNLNNHHASNNLSDEAHPFISLNNLNGHNIRTNLSAARQFNESPSFQRLAIGSSSMNSNNANNTNSISRNRYNNTTSNRANNYSTIGANQAAAAERVNANGAATASINPNNYSQTLKMSNRLNEYAMANGNAVGGGGGATTTTTGGVTADQYLMINNQNHVNAGAFPSAPPAQQSLNNNNPQHHNVFQSYYTPMQTTAQGHY